MPVPVFLFTAKGIKLTKGCRSMGAASAFGVRRHDAAFRDAGILPAFTIRMGTGFLPVPHLFHSRLGQPCYVSSRSTGKPVPHWKPQRGVILSACGQTPQVIIGQT
jgi:hypothetical protein